MADVSPRHPAASTADATTYSPYAVLAVAAVGVSGFFVVLILILMATGAVSKQRVTEPMLLAFPVAGLVLSFAGRRQILNSEGARAGIPLCNAAWWLAVVGGAGYATYLAAIQFAVRTEAANSFTLWAKNLKNIDLSDPKNPGFFRTFDGTLDPAAQGNILPANADQIFKLRKQLAIGIRQADIVRIANRNPGAFDLTFQGLKSWEQTPQGLGCKLVAVAKSPEGEHAVEFAMIAKERDGERTWQVVVSPTGNVTGAKLTGYGREIRGIELSGSAYVQELFLTAHGIQCHNPGLIPLLKQPAKANYPLLALAGQRMSVIGGVAWQLPEPANYADEIGSLFAPYDKATANELALQKKDFITSWKTGRLVPAGRAIQNSPETYPLMFVTKDAVELKVPIELQIQVFDGAAARGHVVLRIDDPAYMAKLNDLRAAAGAETPVEAEVRPPAAGTVPWKLSRVETDMKMIVPDRQRMPSDGAAPPGGM